MKDIFATNQNKASSKVAINSFMMGGLFVVLTLIWTLDPERFSIFIVAQIVLAIPMLFVSSLAYAKIGHWDKVELWDALGWFTSNTGNIFILNSIGLVTAQISKGVAGVYFTLLMVFMAVYSTINVVYEKNSFNERLFKFLFFIVVIAIGGITPLFISK